MPTGCDSALGAGVSHPLGILVAMSTNEAMSVAMVEGQLVGPRYGATAAPSGGRTPAVSVGLLVGAQVGEVAGLDDVGLEVDAPEPDDASEFVARSSPWSANLYTNCWETPR